MSNENNEAPKYPPVRPEITAEIIALDCHLADLILKCKGNTRELDELAGVLDSHLACCGFERDALLLGLPDSPPPPAPLTLTDLPIEEQKMIFATSLFNAMTLSTLVKITGINANYFVVAISQQINIEMTHITDEQISAALDNYLQNYRKNPESQGFTIEIPVVDNN